MKASRYLASTAAFVGCFVGAYAQVQADSTENSTLETVVVTAQKRAQNMQSVPVSMSALTPEKLVSRNVETISDLPQLAPSLTITKGTIPTNNSINLRGIGTSSFSTGIEPSVAVVVDDVALLQQAQAFSGLADIERIEVLRGPQGTLFGKNASAGAINIVTQAPSDVLSGSVTAVYATDAEYRGEASLSGPLTDTLGFRINGFYGDRKGFIHNLTDGRWLNDDRSYGARAKFVYQPDDRVKIELGGSHSVSKSDGSARTFRSVPNGAAVYGASLASSLVGISPGSGNYDIRLDNPIFNKSIQSMMTGKITVDLGFADLISVTSYQDWSFRFVEDYDLLATPILGLPTGIVAGSKYHSHEVTQEVRLVSNGGGPLNYVVGLYYSDGGTDRRFERGPSGPVVAGWNSNSGTRSFAAFSQVTYDLTDTTHIDAGLRANYEKISVRFQNTVASATAATCKYTCYGDSDDPVVTGKLALRQDLAEDVMIYASYARGYKGQGYDISTGFTQSRAAAPIRPETSNAYELGLKSRLWDNRLQLNLAAFWSDYSDFQAQSGVQFPDGTIQLMMNNVGTVRTRGVELEYSVMPVAGLRVDGSIAYTDPMIRSFKNAQCYTGQTAAQGCVDLDGSGPSTTTGQDLSGRPLPNAPRYKFNIGATYDILLPSMPFDAFVQADYNYQSKVNFDLLNNPLTVQKSYGVFNGSVGVNRDGYRIAFYVNNLFDEHYTSNIYVTSGGTPGLLAQYLDRNSRRYFGVRAGYKF